MRDNDTKYILQWSKFSVLLFSSMSLIIAFIIVIIRYFRGNEFVITAEVWQSLILTLMALFGTLLLYLRVKTKFEIFYKTYKRDILDEFSFKGRTLKKLKIMNITNNDLEKMRRELLTNGKKIFIEFSKEMQDKEKDDWFYNKVIEYYDERIKTLPKESLFELYMSYKATQQPKDKARNLFLFYSHASLTYSLNGWFIKKLTRLGYF